MLDIEIANDNIEDPDFILALDNQSLDHKTGSLYTFYEGNYEGKINDKYYCIFSPPEVENEKDDHQIIMRVYEESAKNDFEITESIENNRSTINFYSKSTNNNHAIFYTSAGLFITLYTHLALGTKNSFDPQNNLNATFNSNLNANITGTKNDFFTDIYQLTPYLVFSASMVMGKVMDYLYRNFIAINSEFQEFIVDNKHIIDFVKLYKRQQALNDSKYGVFALNDEIYFAKSLDKDNNFFKPKALKKTKFLNDNFVIPVATKPLDSNPSSCIGKPKLFFSALNSRISSLFK